MKLVIIVGVPGSGKSSIIKAATQSVSALQVVTYGDKILEECAKFGISRDAIRKMPLSDQQKWGIAAAKQIRQEAHGLTLLDTHAVINTPNGYCPGLPREVLEILTPKACVWVESPSSLIIERRKNDSSRKRDEESIESLDLHQDLTRMYMTACSMQTGALLCRVVNGSNSLEKNAQPLIQLLQSLRA